MRRPTGCEKQCCEDRESESEVDESTDGKRDDERDRPESEGPGPVRGEIVGVELEAGSKDEVEEPGRSEGFDHARSLDQSEDVWPDDDAADDQSDQVRQPEQTGQAWHDEDNGEDDEQDAVPAGQRDRELEHLCSIILLKRQGKGSKRSIGLSIVAEIGRVDGLVYRQPMRESFEVRATIPGLATLFDVVLDAAAARRDLDLSEQEVCFEAGRVGCEMGVSLSEVVSVFVAGAGELWESLYSVPDRAVPVESGRSLRKASEQAVSGLAAGFEAAQRRTIRAEEALRREFLDDLLVAGSGERSFRERAHVLAFPADAVFVVVVVEANRAMSDAGPISGRVRRELHERAPDRRFEVFTKNGRLVVVVPNGDPHDLRPVQEGLGAIDGLQCRSGVGGRHAGLDRIWESYEQALESLRLATAFLLANHVVYDDLLPQRFLAAGAVVADDLIDNVLGPLQRGRKETLITTAESFVRHGGNMAEVARQLGVGARTVAYRIDRIAELTGLHLRRPEDRFVVELAIRARPLSRS